MENVKKQKVWEYPLTSKNYKYYALIKYVGSEQTWSCFFKSLKTFDKFKKCLTLIDLDTNNEKLLNQLLETVLQLINELSYYYGNEAITRLSFYNMKTDCYSTTKTLLEFKGLLYNQNIPEANIVNIPFDTELADKLTSCVKAGSYILS